MDTSGLNDYDSRSLGPASGLTSTPQVIFAYFCFTKGIWTYPCQIILLSSTLTFLFQHRNVSNLAIPAGGIDSDIGDTLSVQSWGSRSGKSYTSRKSREGSSHTRQEFGSIMRFFRPPPFLVSKLSSPQACYPQGSLLTDLFSY